MRIKADADGGNAGMDATVVRPGIQSAQVSQRKIVFSMINSGISIGMLEDHTRVFAGKDLEKAVVRGKVRKFQRPEEADVLLQVLRRGYSLGEHSTNYYVQVEISRELHAVTRKWDKRLLLHYDLVPAPFPALIVQCVYPLFIEIDKTVIQFLQGRHIEKKKELFCFQLCIDLCKPQFLQCR